MHFFLQCLGFGLLAVVLSTTADRHRVAVVFGLLIGGLVLLLGAPLALMHFRRPDAQVAKRDEPLPDDERLAQHRPALHPDNGYVTSVECQSCHARNCSTWHASYHSTMTQLATDDSIRAPFDERPILVSGKTYEFRRRDGQFWAQFDDPDAPRHAPQPIERPIVLVTGSHRMQIYWYATGFSRTLGMLPIHYLLDERQWAPKEATLLTPPRTASESDTGRWNSRCVACHTTDARIRPLEGGGFDTEVSQLGISCEACHGPGAQHIAFRRDEHPTGADPIVNPARLSPALSSQVCGVCHSFSSPISVEEDQRELEHGFSFRPGAELRATRYLERWDDATRQHLAQFVDDPRSYLEQRFWSDGVVAAAGREYNGLVESPCHQAGALSCLSCHTLHQPADDQRPVGQWTNDQLKLGMDGNQACVQCHATDRFATPAHTHHSADSAGSQCYNCHMPHTTYGLLGAIRSHQIERPDLTRSTSSGRPAACNLCHLDKTLEWTSQWLGQWYGQDAVELSADQRTVAAGALWTLAGDAQQRALAAWSMGWEPARKASGESWMVPFLVQLLEDPYPAVRLVAWRALRKQSTWSDLGYDFVASATDRRTWAREALERWQRTLPLQPAPDPAVPVTAEAGVNQVEFDRLKRMRNNRAVNLVE